MQDKFLPNSIIKYVTIALRMKELTWAKIYRRIQIHLRKEDQENAYTYNLLIGIFITVTIQRPCRFFKK